jgi:redox-sensitive bicupin YhaK (pirin superfamily)
MSAHAVSARQPQAERFPRSVVLRTRGHAHGAITRLVSPSDLGQIIKPFVFLDYFEGEPADAPSFGFHPHSGIATLTLILSGRRDRQ